MLIKFLFIQQTVIMFIKNNFLLLFKLTFLKVVFIFNFKYFINILKK